MERRDSERLQVYEVVGIACGERIDRVGITRNLSDTGALFHSASKFEVGDTLMLQLRAPGDGTDVEVEALVVRTDVDDPDHRSDFPHLTAVEFKEPLP